MKLHLIEYVRNRHITAMPLSPVVIPDCHGQEHPVLAQEVGSEMGRNDRIHVRSSMTERERGHMHLANLLTMIITSGKDVELILEIVNEAELSFLQTAPIMNRGREATMRWRWTVKLKSHLPQGVGPPGSASTKIILPFEMLIVKKRTITRKHRKITALR